MTIMQNDNETEDGEQNVNRRTVLKGAAVGAGIAGMPGLAAAGGKPCFKDFECEAGDTYVKFEFVIEDDGDCYFEEETNTGLITIDSFTSKEGEPCEPIEVEWSVAEGYGALKVMAYGGQDCVTATDPDPDQSFEPGLEGPGGQTAAISNLQFCVEELEELELPADSYIGYEDRPRSGDFDYNDFGMRATISENYLDDELQTIDMEFRAQFHRAGDSHDIHIKRTFDSSVDWELTLTRNHTAGGNEKGEVTDESGSGTLDVVIFDTDNFTQDNTVTLSVEITSGSVSPPTTSPRPDVEADNALFEVYDPYMDNRSQSTTIDLLTIQDDVVESEIGGGTVEGTWNESDVPNIIVVPDTDFVPPGEDETITGSYPDFNNYYGSDSTEDTLSLDPTYDDWFTT